MLQRVGQQAGRLAQQTSLTSLKQWSEGLQQPAAALAEKMPSWIMLGPPGVGKGTYSSRVAKLLGISHISAGDLVRDEIKNQTECGQQARPLGQPRGPPGARSRCNAVWEEVPGSHRQCVWCERWRMPPRRSWGELAALGACGRARRPCRQRCVTLCM